MFTQPSMKTWGIFHGDKDSGNANSFKSTMKQCLDQEGFDSTDPECIQLKVIQWELIFGLKS